MSRLFAIFVGLEEVSRTYSPEEGVSPPIDKWVLLPRQTYPFLPRTGTKSIWPDHDGPFYVKMEMLLPTEGLEHYEAGVRPVKVPVEVGA